MKASLQNISRLIAGSAAATFLALGLASCGQQEQAREGVLTPAEITNNFDDYKGKTVTVTGHIYDVFGPRTFTLATETGEAAMPVLLETPVPTPTGRVDDRPFAVGDVVSITGVVTSFGEREVNRDLFITFPDDRRVAFTDRPALLGNSIAWTTYSPDYSTTDTTVQGETAAAGDEIRSVIVIANAADPVQLIGQNVSITNAAVVATAGPRAFWLGTDDGKRVLVVHEGTAVRPDANDKVSVLGVLRATPEVEAVRAWQLPSGDVTFVTGTQRVYIDARQVNLAKNPNPNE